MQRSNRANSIAAIANALARGSIVDAQGIANQEFPWERTVSKRQGISRLRALRVFMRDRFIDRYSGSRLVFPGALLAIGQLLPEQFPMHPTWKAGESHPIYWELWPAVDHVIPVTRGGMHDESNFVTTSTNNNVAKNNCLLSEIDWKLIPQPGADENWDGLVDWFRQIVAVRADLLSNDHLKGWNDALRAATG